MIEFRLLGPLEVVYDGRPAWRLEVNGHIDRSASLARAGWLRGFVSGLGALNLWLGLSAATTLWRSVRGARAEPDRE